MSVLRLGEFVAAEQPILSNCLQRSTRHVGEQRGRDDRAGSLGSPIPGIVISRTRGLPLSLHRRHLLGNGSHVVLCLLLWCQRGFFLGRYNDLSIRPQRYLIFGDRLHQAAGYLILRDRLHQAAGCHIGKRWHQGHGGLLRRCRHRPDHLLPRQMEFESRFVADPNCMLVPVILVHLPAIRMFGQHAPEKHVFFMPIGVVRKRLRLFELW